MKIEILLDAEVELTESIEYYEDLEPGLGLKLRNEIESCIHWIKRHHSGIRVRNGGYQRINLRVFPYYIAFVVIDEVIWILAIVHAHRKPEYWVERQSRLGKT